MRVCKLSISLGRGSNAALTRGKNDANNQAPGEAPGARLSKRSVRRDLDEGRELDPGLGHVLGPDGDLLAVLPLQHEAGDQALAVLDPLGELGVLHVYC